MRHPASRSHRATVAMAGIDKEKTTACRTKALPLALLLALTLGGAGATPSTPSATATVGTFTESCRLRRIAYTIKIKDCLPKRLLSYACQGACLSYTQVSADKDAHVERYCSCCQETAQVARNVSVTCYATTEGPRRPFRKMVTRLMLPTRCMCRPCSAGIAIEPLELAGIGDKRNLWTVM